MSRCHHNKKCDTVLALNKVYTGLYPGFMEDKTLPEVVRECEAFAGVGMNGEKGLWRDAYEACQAYSAKYPNGLFSREVPSTVRLLG